MTMRMVLVDMGTSRLGTAPQKVGAKSLRQEGLHAACPSIARARCWCSSDARARKEPWAVRERSRACDGANRRGAFG
jgi:hypothetical protein